MGRETRDTIGRLNPETGAPTLILQEIEFLEKKQKIIPRKTAGAARLGCSFCSGGILLSIICRERWGGDGGDGSIKEFMSNKDEFIR